MDRPANQEDAKLILHLYELRRDPRMREARDWIARSFRVKTMEELQALCPQGSDGHTSFRMVGSYWEMAASFVVHGALHHDLFYENCQEMLFFWERVRELAPKLREAYQNPAYLRNVERVAGSFIKWWEDRAPGAHAVFTARINQIPAAPPKA